MVLKNFLDIFVRTWLFTLSIEMDITSRKRSKVITLHEHTSLNQRQIAKQCESSLGSVNKIIKLKNQTKSVSPKRKVLCGRKRKTTDKDDAILIINSKLNPQKNNFDNYCFCSD